MAYKREQDSAAWFPGDSLEQAQLRKMDALIAKARIAAGEHVLEIGCGWGSLALRAVQVWGRYNERFGQD